MKDHNDHSHDTVKNLAAKHRKELSKITGPVDEIIRSLSEANDKLRKQWWKRHGNRLMKSIRQ